MIDGYELKYDTEDGLPIKPDFIDSYRWVAFIRRCRGSNVKRLGRTLKGLSYRTLVDSRFIILPKMDRRPCYTKTLLTPRKILDSIKRMAVIKGDGVTQCDVARDLQVSRLTLRVWAKKYQLQLPHQIKKRWSNKKLPPAPPSPSAFGRSQ